MAIAKGFVNSNGVKYRIEAAGTIYDEEKNSIALGENTKAASENQLVFGKNNITIAQEDKVEIVGGGDASIPKNIRTLDWEGNQWNAGNISCGGGIGCVGDVVSVGDVQCADDLGGFISMRDLLSRIVALEASNGSGANNPGEEEPGGEG